MNLTPAEALVLMQPRVSQARQALKTTLMALLVQRTLRMDDETKSGMFGRTKHIAHVHLGTPPTGPQPPHVMSVIDVVRNAGSGTMAELVKRAQKTYGVSLNGFVDKFVMPALITRGLVVMEPFRYLLFFTGTRPTLTPAGQAEQATLLQTLAQARTIPDFLDRDPRQAAAMAVALGGLLLLVDELKPHYRALSDAMRMHGASALDGIDNSGGSSFSSVGDFDLGSFDGGAFDTLDTAMSSMDSGFDPAASSGGDSGGSSDSGGGGS